MINKLLQIGYSTLKSEDVQYSLYMKELQRFISRVSQDYLSQFSQSTVIAKRYSLHFIRGGGMTQL